MTRDNKSDRESYFSMSQHGQASRLIASGVNPYDAEEAEANGVEHIPESIAGGLEESVEVLRKGKKRKIDYQMFLGLVGKYSRKTDLVANDPFQGVEGEYGKRSILRQAGYKYLHGDGGSYAIGVAPKIVVGKVFKKTLRLAREENK